MQWKQGKSSERKKFLFSPNERAKSIKVPNTPLVSFPMMTLNACRRHSYQLWPKTATSGEMVLLSTADVYLSFSFLSSPFSNFLPLVSGRLIRLFPSARPFHLHVPNDKMFLLSLGFVLTPLPSIFDPSCPVNMDGFALISGTCVSKCMWERMNVGPSSLQPKIVFEVPWENKRTRSSSTRRIEGVEIDENCAGKSSTEKAVSILLLIPYAVRFAKKR